MVFRNQDLGAKCSLLKCCSSQLLSVGRAGEYTDARTRTHFHICMSHLYTRVDVTWVPSDTTRACLTPQGSSQLSTFCVCNSPQWQGKTWPLSSFSGPRPIGNLAPIAQPFLPTWVPPHAPWVPGLLTRPHPAPALTSSCGPLAWCGSLPCSVPPMPLRWNCSQRTGGGFAPKPTRLQLLWSGSPGLQMATSDGQFSCSPYWPIVAFDMADDSLLLEALSSLSPQHSSLPQAAPGFPSLFPLRLPSFITGDSRVQSCFSLLHLKVLSSWSC